MKLFTGLALGGLTLALASCSAGPHQLREIRRREELAGLAPKHLVPHGYHRVESLLEAAAQRPPRAPHDPPHVLLAPSWGDQTILNLCGERLCEILLDAGFRLTLRPHYHTRRLTPEAVERPLARFAGRRGFAYVERMGEDDSLFDSDVMITDWSGAGMDYAFGLGKPVLYVDLPPKSRNDSWRDLGLEPFESWVRTRIGTLLAPDRLDEAPAAIRSLLATPGAFAADVARLREQSIFNLGRSAAAAADALARLADQPPAPATSRRDRA